MSPTNYNPNRPGTLGVEHLADIVDYVALDASTKGIAAVIPSTTSETYDQVAVWVETADACDIAVELYPSTDVISDARTNDDVLPGTDTGAVTTGWQDASAGAVNFGDVDNFSGSSAYAEMTGTAPDTQPLLFRGSTTALSGRRIEYVYAAIRAKADAALSMSGVVDLSGTRYQSSAIPIGGVSWYKEYEFPQWTVNPATGLPWTLAEVNALINSATDEFGIIRRATRASSNTVRVTGMELRIRSRTENRYAYGAATLTPGSGWRIIDLTTPSGAATVTVGVPYTIVIRRLSGPGTIYVPRLASTRGAPSVEDGYLPAAELVTVQNASGVVTAIENEQDWTIPIVPLLSGPANSVYAQAYAYAEDLSVDADNTVAQRLTTGASGGQYGSVLAVVGGQSGVPVDDLDITVRRMSDSTVLATATILQSELDPNSPTSAHAITTPLDAVASLAASAEVRVEFSSAAASPNGWYVKTLSASDDYEEATLGGTTTAYAEFPTGTPLTANDALVQLLAATDAPADFAVAPTNVVTNFYEGYEGSEFGDECRVETVEAPSISWRTPTRLRIDLAGDYVSTPDAAALDITGDLDVRAWVGPTDWTPSAEQTLVSKWNTSGDQRSYLLTLRTDGTLRLYWSTGGTAGTVLSATSSVATGIGDGQDVWVRATLDVDNGGGGRTVTFYVSQDGTTWTTLGAAQTSAGTTSVYAGTASLIIGGHSGGSTDPFVGDVYTVEVRNGIGGSAVANPDFRDYATGETGPIVDGAGLTWTFAGGASVLTRSYAAGSYVEIQRSETVGEWVTIARLATTYDEISDTEALRGVDVTYRARIVTGGGLVSEWTAEETTNVARISCGLTFTFNATGSPGAVFYPDTDPQDYTFVNADRQVRVAMYGRDYQAVFHETEWRGDEFVATLLTDPTSGRAAFDSLLLLQTALANGTIPYVAVQDRYGRRWLASIALPSGTRRWYGQSTVAPLRITEVTATPVPVEAY